MGKGRVRVVKRADETGKFYSNVFMCGSDPDFKAFRGQIAGRRDRRDPDARREGPLAGTTSSSSREPTTKAPTQWHHDLPYWPFRGTHLISLSVAFTPVDKVSSGVEYIAGSHKWGKFFRAVAPDGDWRSPTRRCTAVPEFRDVQYRNDAKLRYLYWSISSRATSSATIR